MPRPRLPVITLLLVLCGLLAWPAEGGERRKEAPEKSRGTPMKTMKSERARSPLDHARTMRKKDRSAAETARMLEKEWRQGPREAASTLREAGYPAREIARAFQGHARVSREELPGLLVETGIDTEEAIDAANARSFRDPVFGAGDLDCVGPNGLPVACGIQGGGGGAPAMGQVTWSPAGSGQTGSEVVFESTNIPPVDVLFGGEELTVLERTPSRVRAKLPPSPGTGALALRRQSDGVVGVIEDPYQVVAIPPPDPLDTVDWAAAADAALEGAQEDADAWIMGSRFDASRCTVNAVIATAKPGVLTNPSGFEGAVEDRLLEAGAPPKLAEAWQAAFEEAFLEWAEGVMIPGLPWYPALASYPGAQASPMPNVPTPLVSLVSKEMQAMTPSGLVKRLKAGLPDADSPAAQTAIQIFATELGGNFALFVTTAQVHNVMGEGPVPAYQPGVVPAGPVVNGSCSSSGMWASRLPSLAEITLPDPSDFQ